MALGRSPAVTWICAVAVAVLAVAVTVVAIPGFAQAPSQPSAQAPSQPSPPSSPAAAEPPVCVKCHKEAWEGFSQTRHAVRGDARTPFGTGRDCQACHGDASEHLKNPAKNPIPQRFLQGDSRERQERGLPDLSRRQPPPHVLGIGPACEERRGLQQLPQRSRGAAPGERRGRAPAARRDDQPVRDDHPPARVQDLHHLPQADPVGDCSSRRTTRSSRARSSAPTATTRTGRSARRWSRTSR